MTRKKNILLAGFTLIEMLVAISVMLILLAGGTITFYNLSHRQNVLTAGEEVELRLRIAQKKTMSGETPDGCDVLRGWGLVQVSDNPDAVAYRIYCQNGNTNSSTYFLPTGVEISEFPSDLRFLPLYGGVENPGRIVIESGSPTYQYIFEITTGGEISKGKVARQD